MLLSLDFPLGMKLNQMNKTNLFWEQSFLDTKFLLKNTIAQNIIDMKINN